MKAASSLIMWLTLVLVLTLSMVLALVLLLLAELYCSPLLRRHRHRQLTTPNSTTITTDNTSPDSADDDIEKQLHTITTSQTLTLTQLPNAALGTDSLPLVYISNPVFDGENGRVSREVVDDGDAGTPFETPDSSPSRLETEDQESGDDEVSMKVVATVLTPPLTPMKKLPAKACSVCLKDVRSLGTSGSETNGVSSSSSTTPCTSPSL